MEEQIPERKTPEFHYLQKELIQISSTSNKKYDNLLDSCYEQPYDKKQLDFQIPEFQPHKQAYSQFRQELKQEELSQQEEFKPSSFHKKIKHKNSMLKKKQMLNPKRIKFDYVIVREKKRSLSHRTCKCQKSSCIKMYCQCFAEGRFCSDECSCIGCFNSSLNMNREDAILNIKRKNPMTFSTVNLIRLQEDYQIYNKGKLCVKGCSCKKSGCKKKYCECERKGAVCGEHCRCENCNNKLVSKGISFRIGCDPVSDYQNLQKVREYYNGLT